MLNQINSFCYNCQVERKHYRHIFAVFGRNVTFGKKHGRHTRFQVKGRFVNGKLLILTGENGKKVRIGSFGFGSPIPDKETNNC